MAGAEIKDAALGPFPAAAAAKNLSAGKPADEYQRIRGGNIEMFTVHFLVRDFEIFRKTFRDGMAGLNQPKAFLFTGLPPFQPPGVRAQELAEYFRIVPRVKDDESHSVQDPFPDFVHHGIRHLAVCHVTPPDEDIGFGQHIVCQPVFRHVQGRRGCFHVWLFSQEGSDGPMNALRIDSRDGGVILFVAEFVPDGDLDDFLAHGTSFLPDICRVGNQVVIHLRIRL